MINHAGAEEAAKRIAEEIRVEMARQRKSVAALAAVIGVKPHTAGRRLNGSTPFNVIELAAVAGWLGVSMADMLGARHASKVAA